MSLTGFTVPGMNMRAEQTKILAEMDGLISSGTTNIIVSAPTGVGKSLVAKAVASVLGPAWIVTSTKHLQDQYASDFKDIKTIKGMTNFPCLQLMGKMGIRTPYLAMKDRLTCDRGQCVTKMGGKVVSMCAHRAVMDPDLYLKYAPHAGRNTKPCQYYQQKNAGLAARQSALNYAMYFSLTTRQGTRAGVVRPAVVFDEAHTIEDEAVRFVSKDIRGSYFEDTRLDPTTYDMESLDGVLDMLLELRHAYGMRLASPPDEYASAEQIMRYKTMERRYGVVTDIGSAIRADKSNFVLQDPQYGNDGKFKMLSVVPLDMSKILPDMLGKGINVFMSATIRPDIFAKTIGLKTWDSIEIPKSPFPANNRRIRFLDIARMTSRSPPEDEIRVAKAVKGLIDTHAGERGLILTSSKARCQRLLSRLDGSASRVVMAHSENDNGETLKEIMTRHAATEDGVLLSSSLWQGVDLKDDLSRFQIIEKCPWPYLGDRRVEALAKASRGWYEYQTVVKVLQGFGRSVRGPEDHAVTYVMDSAVNGLLKQRREMVPPAYHDTIYPEG